MNNLQKILAGILLTIPVQSQCMELEFNHELSPPALKFTQDDLICAHRGKISSFKTAAHEINNERLEHIQKMAQAQTNLTRLQDRIDAYKKAFNTDKIPQMDEESRMQYMREKQEAEQALEKANKEFTEFKNKIMDALKKHNTK